MGWPAFLLMSVCHCFAEAVPDVTQSAPALLLRSSGTSSLTDLTVLPRIGDELLCPEVDVPIERALHSLPFLLPEQRPVRHRAHVDVQVVAGLAWIVADVPPDGFTGVASMLEKLPEIRLGSLARF
jgi:hypothetical protein